MLAVAKYFFYTTGSGFNKEGADKIYTKSRPREFPQICLLAAENETFHRPVLNVILELALPLHVPSSAQTVAV